MPLSCFAYLSFSSFWLSSGEEASDRGGMGHNKDMKGGETFAISQLCSIYMMEDFISTKTCNNLLHADKQSIVRTN